MDHLVTAKQLMAAMLTPSTVDEIDQLGAEQGRSAMSTLHLQIIAHASIACAERLAAIESRLDLDAEIRRTVDGL